MNDKRRHEMGGQASSPQQFPEANNHRKQLYPINNLMHNY